MTRWVVLIMYHDNNGNPKWFCAMVTKDKQKATFLTSCSRHTSRWPEATIMMVTNHRRQRKASPSKLTGRLSITQLRSSRCSCHRHHQPHCQYDYHNHTCSQWYASCDDIIITPFRSCRLCSVLSFPSGGWFCLCSGWAFGFGCQGERNEWKWNFMRSVSVNSRL